MLTNRNKPVIGDCEVCSNTNVETWLEHGNILMCASCRETEHAVTTKMGEVNTLITQSNHVDTSIQIKSDLFNAGTIASIELKAAIDHDENIPADKKDYAFAELCLARYEHFKKVVFEQRKELLEAENNMRAWQVQTQTAASKLKREEQEKYRKFDVTYQHNVTTKSPKPASTPTAKKKFNLDEVKSTAVKYGVDTVTLQMMMTKKIFKSLDEAGAALARAKKN